MIRRFLAIGLLLLAAPLARAQTSQPVFPFLYPGGYGTFQFTDYINGTAYTGALNVTWEVSGDTAATLSWNTATTLATVTVPKTDTATSLTITATATAADGTKLVQTLVVPILPPPVTHSPTITQQSEVGP